MSRTGALKILRHDFNHLRGQLSASSNGATSQGFKGKYKSSFMLQTT
jgi:hypothetical protein